MIPTFLEEKINNSLKRNIELHRIVIQNLKSFVFFITTRYDGHKMAVLRKAFQGFSIVMSFQLYKTPQVFDATVYFYRCILDCHIDFVSAGHIPPRLKSNLEDIRKEEQSSIFICKCNVCKKYFSNKFKFEIHDCSPIQRRTVGLSH